MRKKDKGQSTPPKLLKSKMARKAKMQLLKFGNNNVPWDYQK